MDSFEPHIVFQRIDRDCDGVIGTLELLRFLRQMGIQDVNEADCFTLINYFNNDHQNQIGVLSFNDFT